MSECYDCKRPYGDFPDLLVPHYIWRQISPTADEGGLLCPSCMCRRLENRRIVDVPGAFMSGPIRSVDRELMSAILGVEQLRVQLESPSPVRGGKEER